VGCARLSIACLLACAGASVRAAYVRPAPQRIDVAKDVYLFVSKPYGDVGLDGNSVAIVGRDAVLVFDTNGTPASAANVLGEIRKVTDRPIRYVVYSHWHWDHWYGTQVTRSRRGPRKRGDPPAATRCHGRHDEGRPETERPVPGLPRRLDAAPRLRRAQRLDQ
jgi:glyoxylase-like metal-dependent hydrolase (beta-lactamase superfamily II)